MTLTDTNSISIDIPSTSGPKIIIGGPFPPPIHGAAIVTDQIAEKISARTPVLILNLSAGQLARGVKYHFKRLFGFLTAVSVILTTRSARKLMLSLDGGIGLIYSAALILTARLRGVELFLYHHSASYVNTFSPLMKLVTLFAGVNALHIMCSHTMIEMFRGRYPNAQRFFRVGNAAFVDIPATLERHSSDGVLVFGILSNLCRPKGLALVLETLKCAHAQGLKCHLLLAGPIIDDDAQQLIDKALIEMSASIELVGPVSGPAKDDFFRRLDVFIFPSLYPHETQSLVVPEALAYGVPVLTRPHNFITELGDGGRALSILTGGPNFPIEAATLLISWSENSTELEQARSAAKLRFKELHEDSRCNLSELICRIIG